MGAIVSTPEEKYYDAMNTLLAPVRLVVSLLGTVCITLLLIGIGLFYPLSLCLNGEPVTAISFAVSFLTIIAVFTMFYAPCYFFGFGFVCLVIFGMLCEHGEVDTNPAMAFLASSDGWTLAGLIFTFLLIGILQRYIRRCIFDLPKKPKPKPLSFVDQMNQDIRRKRRPREYDAMSQNNARR